MRACRQTTFLILVLVATPAFAQQDDDDFPNYRPGLIGEYQASGVSCRRTDDVIKFVWQDAPPDPRLPSGAFSAHWRGRLFSIEPGDYQLHVYAAGDVELHLNGQSLLKVASKKPAWHAAQTIKLTYGHHPLEIRYRSAKASSELALFWQGPRFQLEPLPAWHLFHDPAEVVSDEFQQGQRLVRALRCSACHEVSGEGDHLPAPSLAKLTGNLERDWLVEWLTQSPHGQPAEEGREPIRRMPQFLLDRPQAEAIASFLVATWKPMASQSAGDTLRGERLFLTTGCLACHQAGSLGKPSLFGGGDLTRVARKRPADFFDRWLADPAQINPAHRMPVFKLGDEERTDLAAWLKTLVGDQLNEQVIGGNGSPSHGLPSGRELVAAHRCAACHALPDGSKPPKWTVRIDDKSDWSKSCLASPKSEKQQPGYGLSDAQAAAIRAYFREIHPDAPVATQRDGRFVLEERNCVACHARGPEGGIAALLPAVVERVPELAPELPLLTAPSLLGVGDKLQETALAAAISTRDGPRRPWLSIRMPRFHLADEEMQTLVKHFVQHDRIPDGAPARPISRLPDKKELTAAGARIVTADGFGCTSCHKIGEWTPKKVALNARGTELSVLGDRLRKPWFDRWVRNPSRIVPRMEMPSVVTPARKILDENLDHQLAAVWQVLNQPNFTPPAPSAIRLVNTTNQRDSNELAQVLTDVLEAEKYVFIRPLLIALPNRHNILIDQETNALAGWWTGDAALQRTRGKSWYWEPSGSPFWPLGKPEGTDVSLQKAGDTWKLDPHGQYAGLFESFRHVPRGIQFECGLRFRSDAQRASIPIRIVQTITAQWPDADTPRSGFRRRLEFHGLPKQASLRFAFAPGRRLPGLRRRDEDGMPEFQLSDSPDDCRIRVIELSGAGFRPVIEWSEADEAFINLTASSADRPIIYDLLYTSARPVDQVLTLPAAPPLPSKPLHVTPGYDGVRLPLAEAEMPTALAWREDGTLIVCSLKGRVCLSRDTDGDGLEDQIMPFSDELAAPYGAAAHKGAIDVITKYALLRLHDANNDGRAERTEVLASGWGHTADYHDWAVGLPRDKAGNYYVALPCQQDDRSPAAAHLRGRGLKISPRKPTAENPQPYGIEAFCEGLRFPMGLAMNRQGQLFASDNQGNYNPFNELNHLVPGRHYGFINKLEFKPGERPPLTPPAIDIPHPWTRSVNGICFLETPPAVREKLGRDAFGPHEGHLIGCEYDTRQLVRMSLEQIGDTWQGAIYPFTMPPEEGQEPLQGPVCCEVSPAGDLYVGSMRDSGWGAGANVGSIVRLRPTGKLPAGIAEVRAAPGGFVIEFTQPVDARLALDHANYAVSSYRRISTPAYGGPDADRQAHSVRRVEISADRKSVRLEPGELREGFVYEFRLKHLVPLDEAFHPAEAHYTLRVTQRP